MRKITLFLVTLAISVSTMAVGGLSGTYKVGTGEVAPNFALLSEAVTAINTQGLAGDVILEITSDITEPANIGLGVNTNGYSITIRPDADANRTITFTQLADNTSPTGHFVIGYPTSGLSSAWSINNTIATNNVTIDGYSVGGNTRRLTFTNTSASHTNARVIVVVGACINTTIKNCIINNLTTHTGSPFCVGAVVRKVGTAAADAELAPNGLVFENNLLTAIGNTVAMGARITNSNTPATAKVTGLVFKNNTVTARRRLLEINYTDGAEISGNNFTTEQTGAPGTISYGLWTSTGVTGTLNIHSNKFLKAFTEETSGNGHRVVSLSSGATYNIYNNTFAGLDKTKASTTATNLVYLFYSGVAGKIYNNTFYMPALTDPSSTGYYAAIQLSGNTAEIRNNIFVADEPTHANTYFISAVPSPASDNNIFEFKSSNANSKFVSTFTSLAAYQSANTSKDVNSRLATLNFVDAAAGDLRIAGLSIQDNMLAVPRLPEVLKDMFGTDRAEITYAGAHQSTLPFVVSAVEAPATQQRIARTATGILIELDRTANIEIYTVNGMLIERARTNNYTRDLNNGIYIIRIDGVATKFVK